MRALLLICTSLLAYPLAAAPAYDFDQLQLEAILADLRNWLPGDWNSFPQVWYERNVSMPAEGEHEHWHRTFALIDAPQIGATVFYGQVNIGGPDGPILARSQVLYRAFIDADKGVVTIHGQPLADPEAFADLHERPELWPRATMPNEDALQCRFDWRRHGRQLVGILDNREERSGGVSDADRGQPGTCMYTARNDMPFLADAEWVLSPDELWLYDINLMGGVQFVGRADRTHLRLYRTEPYSCALTDAAGTREAAAHDRGFTTVLTNVDDAVFDAMLLRAWYPGENGGLVDELRLSLTDADGATVVVASAPPRTMQMEVKGRGVRVACERG